MNRVVSVWLWSVLFMGCASIAMAQEPAPGQQPEPIVIGLDADMSSGSAVAGEAIRRGALMAMAEINEQGGLLGGRALQLVVKDHHGIPVRSTENLLELAKEKNLVAVLGGLHSPAIMQNLPLIHEQQLLLLDPWAAATPVIDNGYKPNYVFRISLRDEYVGGFLVEQALRQGDTKLGLLLERTGWGRSNEKGMSEALAKHQKKPAGIQWFNWGDTDMTAQLIALEEAGADAIMMVANAPEGAAIVQNLAKRPQERRLPVFAHWGITGGDFIALTGEALKQVRLQVVQTYSFLDANDAKAKAVITRYQAMFGTKDARDIVAPVGTAHAYDLVHVLALAIEKAGTIERAKVRDALESIESYDGLVRRYQPPFTPEWHEGLDPSDYRLAMFDHDGVIVPVPR